MADRQKILRHIETSVDVDEWAVVGVKENFDKLDMIEEIVNNREGFYLYDNLPPFQQIKKVLKQE